MAFLLLMLLRKSISQEVARGDLLRFISEDLWPEQTRSW